MKTRTWKAVSRPALLLLWALAGSSGFGQEWAKEMFDHTSHDFGTVARGAKVEHKFTLENIYVENVHVAAIRSTCGCTGPKISQRTLKTWEKAEITAPIDTRGYYGRKDATVTVVFDKPFPAEVQLRVHTYIRSDVVVQPGWVEFGTVTQGTAARRKLTISYAGRPDWEIKEVETGKPYLQAEVVKLAASPAGQVTYSLLVTLEDTAPVGEIREQLILVTNDSRKQAARVPVAVEGDVVPPLTVRPSPLLLGVVGAGQTVTRRLVVQANKPFRITSATCSHEAIQCAVADAQKSVHLVSVTFTAGEVSGKLSGTIRIQTDLAAGGPLEVPVHVRVIPQSPQTF